jgi:hypothetical protein
MTTVEAEAAQGIPERYTLVKHLRRHGKATAMHLWCSACRWCRFQSWLDTIKEPASRDHLLILQQRVTALESARIDGGEA